MDAIPETRRVH